MAPTPKKPNPVSQTTQRDATEGSVPKLAVQFQPFTKNTLCLTNVSDPLQETH